MITVRQSTPLKRILVTAAVLFLLVIHAPRPANAQDIEYVRNNARRKLPVIREYLEERYYDPTFQGMNLVTRFKAADEKIKQATSNGQIFGAIAQLLDDLNDSHTYFIPPPNCQSANGQARFTNNVNKKMAGQGQAMGIAHWRGYILG